MLVIPSVNEAFNHSLPWSLFVVTSVIEPNTGGWAGGRADWWVGGGWVDA